MSNEAEVIKIGDVQTLTVSGYEIGLNFDAVRYYFTEEFLEKQILIRLVSYWEDENLIENLDLFYCSDEEAVVYELYEGECLNSIVAYNIVSTMVELYRKSPTIDEFIKAVQHLSVGYMSASGFIQDVFKEFEKVNP